MGAALVAQAMSGGDVSMCYKAMQAVKDWDRTRLAYRTVKRAFDIVFSGCVLAVIAIPSLVLAAAIRLESGGNPFYSQIRVGQTHRDGSLSTFRMWKFRSMYKDADERLAELKGQNEIAGAMFKMKDDPRVTKIGKFIRKHSIDEFPQFLNVFLGQMSAPAAAERGGGVHRVRPAAPCREAGHYRLVAGDRSKFNGFRRNGPARPGVHRQARRHHGSQDRRPHGD